MKIAVVIGARPQFIKAKRELDELNRITQVTTTVIHTGQHYDYEMSRLFFDELDIPEPDYDLGVGSGEQGVQTGTMMIGMEEVLKKHAPDMVVVFGDTNSTIAGALAAAKLNIPVAHIEAGLRSYNRKMPEEINRVLTDHVSDLLFCPTTASVENLKKEGITEGVFEVGDVMFDTWLSSIKVAEERSGILDTLGLTSGGYYLATVHRASNTDNIDILRGILEALSELDLPVVFPVHPRTRKAIGRIIDLSARRNSEQLMLIDPVGYLNMIFLEKNARKIITDSGGIQKEAYFAKVPCVTLREETEWVETVEAGWNVLTGLDRENIVKIVKETDTGTRGNISYGNGESSKRICQHIVDHLQTKQ